MLSQIERGKTEVTVTYEKIFDDGSGNGYAFPCDAEGHLLCHPSAVASYNWCLLHPENFIRFNMLERREQHMRHPDTGKCSCGEIVSLRDQYYGACQCPRCGKWYNLSGQELLPPDMWGWDGTPLDDDY